MGEAKRKEDARPEVNREKVTAELNELNNEYKALVQKRQSLINELNGINEELAKKVGAFQALRKLLGDNVEVKDSGGK